MTKLTIDAIRHLPKVTLHDHLDGGLRPQTVIDLVGKDHQLPASDAEALGRWFADAADSGSLVRYLETFEHTIAAMQTAEALQRVAREFVEDMVSDGVVYAETRWAPEQHLRLGLSLDDAVVAVQRGLDEASDTATASGKPIVVRQIISAMRQNDRSQEIAELAMRYRELGVGFDIAGPEAGFPPSQHLPAFNYLRSELAWVTIHAGEAAGPESMREALIAGAQRLGHGVRIIDDITRDGEDYQLGELARYVRDHEIPLELCPSSNVQTGAAASVAEHPFGVLAELGFTVTVNCDNRLMSATSLSRELALLAEAFDYGWSDLYRFTCNAARAAFLPLEQRRSLIEDVITPAYAIVAQLGTERTDL